MSGGTGISWRSRREQSWVLFLLSALFVVLAAIPGDRLGPWWLKAALAVVCGVGGVAVARMKQSAKQDHVDVDTLEKSMLTAARGTAPIVSAVPLYDLGVHKAVIEILYLRRTSASAC